MTTRKEEKKKKLNTNLSNEHIRKKKTSILNSCKLSSRTHCDDDYTKTMLASFQDTRFF